MDVHQIIQWIQTYKSTIQMPCFTKLFYSPKAPTSHQPAWCPPKKSMRLEQFDPRDGSRPPLLRPLAMVNPKAICHSAQLLFAYDYIYTIECHYFTNSCTHISYNSQNHSIHCKMPKVSQIVLLLKVLGGEGVRFGKAAPEQAAQDHFGLRLRMFSAVLVFHQFVRLELLKPPNK